MSGLLLGIIIIIIIIGISFMQCIYKHVPREQCVAAILVLLFMVLISLVPALTLLLLLLLLLRNIISVLCWGSGNSFKKKE